MNTEEPSKEELWFILDESPNKRKEKLVHELHTLSPKIDFAPLNPGIIRIPPKMGVMYLTADDLKKDDVDEIISSRIKPFLEKYSPHLLIVEGFTNFGEEKQAFLFQLLNQVVLNFHLGFIPTRNVADTVICLRSIARREQIQDKPPSLGRVKSKPKTVQDSQKTLIEGLLQCGPIKAEEALLNLENPAKIFDAIQNNPKEIESLKGFGPKFIDVNRRLLTLNYFFSRNTK